MSGNLPEAVQSLCETMGDRSLHCKVRAFLTSAECQRVLVACSGGADSVFMLCQLWGQREALGLQPVVAHYNHRWRGVESDEDARFVEALARQLNCPFVTETRPENVSAMTETRARALRLDFLRAAARERGCQCIAFGHQQDDILETQLQRLARGSGVDGLAAPRPVHRFDAYPTHIRPLLHLSAGTIRKALQASAIVWREDASNEDTGIARNALRHFVIPELQNALEHSVCKGAARSRELLEDDALALDQLARELLPEAFGERKALERAALSAAPRALTRRALNDWIGRHNLSKALNAAAMDRLIDAIYTGKERFRLSAGAAFIEVDARLVRIELADASVPPLEPCALQVGESVVLSTGAVLTAAMVPVDAALRLRLAAGAIDVDCEAYLDWAPGLTLRVRSRQPGDSFQPLGAPGKKKLKEWFIDRRISARERNLLPLVITDSGEIAWAPGLPPAENLKINTTTKQALKLTYKTRKTTLTD